MILEMFPDIDRAKRILFTPNFAPREEFELGTIPHSIHELMFAGFELGVIVNLDSQYPLENWPEVFRLVFQFSALIIFPTLSLVSSWLPLVHYYFIITVSIVMG